MKSVWLLQPIDAKRFLRMKLIIVGIIGFCGLTIISYLLQDSLIFFPIKITQETLQSIRKAFPHAEEINITAADNKILHGWLVKGMAPGKNPLVIYCGGNAEELSYLIADAAKFNGWSLALINYRGYGLSEGKPGEKELFSDALAVYDYFSKRSDIDNNRILVIGRSIGSGVATYLAQKRPVNAVILVCPFDSLVRIGRKYYPFLPVKLLLKHRFDSISRAPAIKVPMLALVAAEDSIIPRDSSMRLIEQWGGQHTVKIIEGDHNTLQEYPGYWESIEAFLGQY
jgi:hypothetical protein